MTNVYEFNLIILLVQSFKLRKYLKQNINVKTKLRVKYYILYFILK